MRDRLEPIDQAFPARKGSAEDRHLELQYERALGIIAHLEELSRSPNGFHQQALPLIQELREVCFAGLGSEPSHLQALPRRLLNEFVEDSERIALLRSSVFLALAPRLEINDFRRVFDLWIRDRQLPRELLRAAALGAALRGSVSACSEPIDLGDLARLPVDPNIPNPGVFPLSLTTVVEDYEAMAMLSALMDFDPLLDRIESTQELPSSKAEALEAAESTVARQVLMLTLGQRSLEDAELESLVLSIADFTYRKDGNPRVDFCAALLIAHSLCNCSDPYLDFLTASAASPNPLVAGSYRMLQELGVGPMNRSLLSKLYSMRWAETEREQMSMADEITKLGERLGEEGDFDSEQRSEFLGFMRELVGDVSEAEEVRMASMFGLQAAGDWETTLAAAADVFDCVSSNTLKALAFDGVMAAATKSAGQRELALGILISIRDSSTEAWVLSDAQAFIDQLQ